MNKKSESKFQVILGGIGIVIVLLSTFAMSQKIGSGSADAIMPSIIGIFVGFGFLAIAVKIK